MTMKHYWGDVYRASGKYSGHLEQRCRLCGIPRLIDRIEDGVPVVRAGQKDYPCQPDMVETPCGGMHPLIRF